MEKNKLAYIVLFLIGTSLLAYSAQLLKSRSDLDPSQRSGLIKQGSEYILQMDITNDALIDSNYTISVFIDETQYDENIFLPRGSIFTYKHHFYPPLKNKWVNVSVYKEGETDPVSKSTYLIE